MKLIRNNETHICSCEIDLSQGRNSAKKAAHISSLYTTDLQVKQVMRQKMQLSDIFISNGISSELFKRYLSTCIIEKEKLKVLPQDSLVPLSLKSNQFTLCFAHLQKYLAFM